MNKLLTLVLLVGTTRPSQTLADEERGREAEHDTSRFVQAIQNQVNQGWFEGAEHWKELAKSSIRSREDKPQIEAEAKNAIFFIGDGMGVTGVTASRVYKGQKDDGLRFGEEAVLHMDTFPYSGASKTYCLDTQVADTACSATAYVCGVKARFSTTGLGPNVPFGHCMGQNNTANHLTSLVDWAQKEGKSTGIVTTWRVTAAPMSSHYAGVAARGWETDTDVRDSLQNPQVCPDAGAQLVMHEAGRKLNVLMGGGRQALFAQEDSDIETGQPGKRSDGRNIAAEWMALKPSNESTEYITGRDQLMALDTSKVDNLLATFAPSGLPWHDQLDANNDPTLEEMVEVAIKILSKNPKGYYLFVHADRIDSALHRNILGRSLREIVEFDKSIKKGDEMTDDSDTLLVVSADHSHTLGFAAYNVRGNSVLKHSIIPADDGVVFTTLFFANGPGPSWMDPATGNRRSVLFDDADNIEYQVPSPVPMGSEAHGSEDVPIFAKGPYAHYFSGVHEQSSIPHLIAYAMCTGEGLRNPHCNPTETTTSDEGSTTSDEGSTTNADSLGYKVEGYCLQILSMLAFNFVLKFI